LQLWIFFGAADARHDAARRRERVAEG
jgi:hypothetical protein